MKYLNNYMSKEGFIKKGTVFKGSKELEKELLSRNIIGKVEVKKAEEAPKA